MKKPIVFWKAIDAWGQVVVFLLPYLFSSLRLPSEFRLPLIDRGGLLSLGGWQVTSFIIHWALPDKGWKERGRIIYGLLLGFVVFCGLLSLITGTWMIYLIGLIFLSPAMALLYFIVSFSEYRTISGKTSRQEVPNE